MRVSYLAISDKRCTIQIGGCNFRCKGCFSREREERGEEIPVARLLKHILSDKEVMIAGGEPTIDRKGLVSLIDQLDRKKTILSTNGYLLDEKLLEELEGISVHIDLKALDPELHQWYTGKDNKNILSAIQLLYEQGFDFEVSTVFIPGIIDIAEIENIARYLSGIGNIRYKIMRYVPVGTFSRRPHILEIKDALNTAKKYLNNVTSSLENRSHPEVRNNIDFTQLSVSL